MDILAATILVLVVTNQQLVLAADSRKTNLYPWGIGEKETCNKICHTNGFYYAVSGFYAAADGSLSIPAFLHKVFLKHSCADKAVKLIAQTLTPALREYFSQLKKDSPDLFRQYLHHSGRGGEVFVVKRINKTPTAYVIDYTITHDTPEKVVLHTAKTDTVQIAKMGRCFWRAIGHTAFLQARWPATNELAAAPVEKARWLIEQGVQHHPHFVGMPVQVVEMTGSAETWRVFE